MQALFFTSSLQDLLMTLWISELQRKGRFSCKSKAKLINMKSPQKWLMEGKTDYRSIFKFGWIILACREHHKCILSFISRWKNWSVISYMEGKNKKAKTYTINPAGLHGMNNCIFIRLPPKPILLILYCNFYIYVTNGIIKGIQNIASKLKRNLYRRTFAWWKY